MNLHERKLHGLGMADTNLHDRRPETRSDEGHHGTGPTGPGYANTHLHLHRRWASQASAATTEQDQPRLLD